MTNNDMPADTELREQLGDLPVWIDTHIGTVQSLLKLQPETLDSIMQLIKQRDAAILESTRIMGKSIDEVVTILRALDVERVSDIKVTMSNLDKLYEKLRDDIEQGVLKARKASIEQLSTPTDQKEKSE